MGAGPYRTILIAGPTASGKSELAVQIAEAVGGIVINADSMQVYDGLNLLTARPSAADLARVPHRLYGHVDPATAHSAGQWLRDVKALGAEGRRVFVGGTGLYFKALIEGLGDLPPVPAAIRTEVRRRVLLEGPAALRDALAVHDPAAAAALSARDGQRIARALEVVLATGRTLAAWQAAPAQPPVVDCAAPHTLCLVLDPGRAAGAERIERRFAAMIAGGAIAEVEALLARSLDPDLPVMKAIGVREIGGLIAGTLTLAEAKERAVIATRQYAKRQRTWFRGQFGPDWHRVGDGSSALRLVLGS